MLKKTGATVSRQPDESNWNRSYDITKNAEFTFVLTLQFDIYSWIVKPYHITCRKFATALVSYRLSIGVSLKLIRLKISHGTSHLPVTLLINHVSGGPVTTREEWVIVARAAPPVDSEPRSGADVLCCVMWVRSECSEDAWRGGGRARQGRPEQHQLPAHQRSLLAAAFEPYSLSRARFDMITLFTFSFSDTVCLQTLVNAVTEWSSLSREGLKCVTISEFKSSIDVRQNVRTNCALLSCNRYLLLTKHYSWWLYKPYSLIQALELKLK